MPPTQVQSSTGAVRGPCEEGVEAGAPTEDTVPAVILLQVLGCLVLGAGPQVRIQVQGPKLLLPTGDLRRILGPLQTALFNSLKNGALVTGKIQVASRFFEPSVFPEDL